jgi:hypothetical protein
LHGLGTDFGTDDEVWEVGGVVDVGGEDRGGGGGGGCALRV